MRNLLIIGIILMATPLLAQNPDWRLAPSFDKEAHPIATDTGTPDGREGGETFADAFEIPALPFQDTGNTSDNDDDYGEMCPYGSWAPDVVYSFTSDHEMYVAVDLCGSTYDTAVFVWDADLNLIACNDDFYIDHPDCMDYVSKIEYLLVPAGITYYIVVDGYTNSSGDYVLSVDEIPDPGSCELTCDGTEEGEPPLMDGYVDEFNGGCYAPDPENSWQILNGDEMGELVFCGQSGWFFFNSMDTRDTDWFIAVIGPTGMLEWTLDAEEETFFAQLAPMDCNFVSVAQGLTAGSCAPATMTVQGEPGDVVWLWVGAGDYTAPPWFEGNEFNYVGSFNGLEPGIIPTEALSFDRLKSLYR